MSERIPLGAFRYVKIPTNQVRFRVNTPDGITWEYQRPSGEQEGATTDFTNIVQPCPVCGAEAYIDLGPYWCYVRYRCEHNEQTDPEQE